jgi:hypothetical protein
MKALCLATHTVRPLPRLRGRVGEGAPLAQAPTTCPLPARTDLGFTRDRQINVRKSGRPDLRARVPPPLAGEGKEQQP